MQLAYQWLSWRIGAAGNKQMGGSWGTHEGHGLSAALRRFPLFSLQIKELCLRDESFRGLCEDLDAVEHALSRVEGFPPAVREDRRAEFEAMAEGLAAEIEETLGKTRPM